MSETIENKEGSTNELTEKQKSRLMNLAERAGVPYEEVIAKNMSQSALKKIASKKRYEEALKHKRQQEKTIRKKYIQQNKQTGTFVKKKRKAGHLMKNSNNKVIVAIDLSFNDLMTEKDLKKLRKQILRCYSANRSSENPLQFYLTSCTQQIKDSFNSLTSGFENWDLNLVESDFLEKFKDFKSQENGIVYLTRDSNNVLPESNVIQENMGKTVYVIGGLVDHNSYKRLTIDMAEKEKIGHARLPIAENIRMTKSHVLTVNHVFELMLLVSQGVSWKSALEQVIPPRKIFKDANGKDFRVKDGDNNDSSQSDDSENDDDGDDAGSQDKKQAETAPATEENTHDSSKPSNS